MARGRGGKPKRGGGRSFTKMDMKTGQPLESSRTPDRWREAEENESGTDEEEDEEDEEEESDDEEENGDLVIKTVGPVDEERSKLANERDAVFGNKKVSAKAGEEDPAFQVANPNRAGNKSVKASELDKVEVKELSRREREAQQAAAAKERYWKMHQAGKTDEAKADLARLSIIRKQREEAAASKKAEAELKAKEAQSKIEARKSGRR